MGRYSGSVTFRKRSYVGLIGDMLCMADSGVPGDEYIDIGVGTTVC